MNIVNIIDNKRLNNKLTYEELDFVVTNFINNQISSEQMSALLMTMDLNGMSEEEIFDLTDILIKKNEITLFGGIEGNLVDNVSVDEYGDPTTIVLFSLLASCGCKVGKISSKEYEYTNNLIEKLQAIPGFNINMNIDDFVNQINNIGISLIESSSTVSSINEKICTLTKSIGVTNSIPLMASFIMSKKISEGCKKIIINIKVGEDGLLSSVKEAEELSDLMVKIGKIYGVEVVCVLTNSYIILGSSFGNSLEIKEVIDTIQGQGPKNLTNLAIVLSSYLLAMDKNISFDEAKLSVIQNIRSGNAYNKFLELIRYQQGDINKVTTSDKLFSIKSPKTGFISKINISSLQNVVCKIGGKKQVDTDSIDHSVGIVLSKQVGDYVVENEELAKVYLNEHDLGINEIIDCFEIDNSAGKIEPLIIKIIK